ncbi:hypothetical protein SARC_10321 [Sphaeroforma arctica JP610]|uniref:DUF1731 domain-containing protein n=1 Tax=Sphaeroforma arctica JP610 TaxID=667725 RepID=A0A0L0FMF7_9EUKA|nr:hypothetical protein SARC_10321 [Sphaeroforma arctica JP610]KNC77213.1 hypothetical protein SARC_10321 [Sphaeroforma arctica JP610]|eukprot:XP_014151115.1 hypothetical protein SARC_10321 [Sphaeroforma arctica JP610]
MLKKVVIGGGSGYVGGLIKKALERRGTEVIVLSRSAGAGRITWDEVRGNGLPECDAVVNCSGQNVLDFTKRWTPEFERSVRESRIDRTRDLAKSVAAMAKPPKVFVATSGIGYYPTSAQKTYDESSEGGAGDYWSALSQEWEDSGKLLASVSTRHAIVRLSVVLGRDGGAYPQMRFPFAFGVGGNTGTGEQWFPWVHEEDMVGIFLHALENDAVKGPINGIAPESDTNAQFVRKLASIMHRPYLFTVPGFVMSTLLGKDRSAMLLEGQNVKPTVAMETGYQFKYPDLESCIKALES